MIRVRQDLVYAFRQLRRQPALSTAIVLTLALGLGVNAAIFSVADAVLLKSLPVKDPEQLVLFQWTSGPHPRVEYMTGEFWRDPASGRVGAASFSYPSFERFRTRGTTLSTVFASAELGRVNVSFGGEPDLAEVMLVSGDYYAGLGVTAMSGRTIARADDRPGSDIVAVISHDYWQRHFGGDPDVVGRVGTVEAHPVTIIGIASPSFSGTMHVGTSPDIAVPLAAQAVLRPKDEYLKSPDWYWLQIMARLKPGVSWSQAQAEMGVLLGQGTEDIGDHPQFQLAAGNQGWTTQRREQSSPLLVLTGVAWLVLLMACASVAGLLLARTAARSKEMGIRAALGASRWTLIRQLFTESTLLAALSGGVGLLLARWTKDLLAAGLIPGSAIPADIDGRVMAFLAAISLATGLLSGLAPALRTTRAETLRDGAPRVRRGTRFGPDQVLVIAQVALSLMLLVGSALLLRTLLNLTRIETGFEQERILLFKVQAVLDEKSAADLAPRLVERLRALPGVRAVGVADHHLLGDNTDRMRVEIAGDVRGIEMNDAYVNRVGGEFFSAMGIPIRSGRPIGLQDVAGTPPVIVVNEAFVRQFFAGRNPLGHRVNAREVVGVVADTKYGSLRDDPPPTMFVPSFQGPGGSFAFQIRSDGSVAGLPPIVRQIVREIAPTAVPYDFTAPSKMIEDSVGQERLLANVTSLFSVLALLLASLGLYGSTAYAIGRRTREIGLRIALGAQPADVFQLVAGDSLRLSLTGAALGLAGALALTGLMRNVLYGVTPADPLSLVAAALVLASGTMLACWLPARRAMQLDPTVALKLP